MFNTSSKICFQRTTLALAVGVVLIPVQAQVPPVDLTVTMGLGLFDGQGADRGLLDQYSGMRKDSEVAGNLDIDYTLRKDEKAGWVDFQGSGLLGDMRELNLVWKEPGDWKFTADYSELLHHDPNQVNTGLVGAGTTTPQVVALPGGAGSGYNLDLQTKRTKLGLGFTKEITPRLQFMVDLKTENKEGSRLSGIGMTCPTVYDPTCSGTTGIQVGSAALMIPEPIDANHSQIEARMSYALEKLRFSVGYYGSFYRNNNSSLNPVVSGNLYNAVGTSLSVSPGLLGYLNQPIALSPDNQMQQLDLTGNYAFTRKTLATFKVAFSQATQDDSFVTTSLPGRTSLGAKVNTTLVDLGLTSRPMPKLSLLANFRYQDRDDQTPIAYYNLAGTTAYTNQALPNRKTNGKLEAGWQFNGDYKGIVGADFESIDRGTFTATSAIVGLTALRQQTDETTLRAELRRRMSEDLSGSVSVSSSRRDGSNWLKDNSGLGVTALANPADPAYGLSTGIFMPTLADRQRDKVKVFADWEPNKKLSMQLSAESGTDKYNYPSANGLSHTRMDQFSLDASYVVSFRLAFNGYVSYGVQTYDQSRTAGYVMAFENTNTTVGVGVMSKPTDKLELGANLSYMDDQNKYKQTLDIAADSYSVASLAAAGGLPDIVYRQTTLKLFGKYALDKKSAVRVDFVHQKVSYNDWAWGYNGVPYTYADGTTVTQKQDQSVNYVGVSYIYKF
ncbi:MtrB/PioB family decaheme-associated outer membrane protein [Rhodoferax sp.]|uniref:MtrB/PioB family decaheme-associated outer membrane protein n=1 Tax=Rhodoferax sp. TaxID=50421 RepID=UPI00283D3A62|nr:MtrB/PioB family decaheme-associated outer membrane protein [Rhodoferax sp.]MDR3368966.1 MtrB/PioB family decaheme-associated outer membrane protein [Rhodoferax sp.]